ncbi:hypothetical protein CIP106467_3876 [Citrobacter europaeus]|nr:hypothetical protein CIP106467_3876 [Citrobacter europaeus]
MPDTLTWATSVCANAENVTGAVNNAVISKILLNMFMCISINQ